MYFIQLNHFSFQTDMKDIQIKLGMEKEKCQQYAEELKTTKQALEKLETRVSFTFCIRSTIFVSGEISLQT